MPIRDSHHETMTKKVIRAEIGLLSADWFLPIQAYALDRALELVNDKIHWKEAAHRGLEEAYSEFNVEGLAALVRPALEAGKNT